MNSLTELDYTIDGSSSLITLTASDKKRSTVFDHMYLRIKEKTLYNPSTDDAQQCTHQPFHNHKHTPNPIIQQPSTTSTNPHKISAQLHHNYTSKVHSNSFIYNMLYQQS